MSILSISRSSCRGVELGGQYTLARYLGESETGPVFEAHDMRLDRPVALKLLRYANDHDRLLREARVMARLSHVNVAQVYEVANLEMAGVPFIVREYIDGVTLRRWLSSERSLSDILRVFRAAGRGIAALHAVGVVHRDLCADNVMISSESRVVVTDLGFARHHEEEATLPDGSHSGTWEQGALLSSAPEHLEGAPHTIYADQFAFCMMLWEAIYGQPPEPDACAQPRTQQGRGVPRWLRKTLERGLSPAPNQRWTSMHELLTRLERAPVDPRRVSVCSVVLMLGLGLGFGTHALGRGRVRARALADCEAQGDAIYSTWNAKTQAQLEASFTANGRSYAANTWTLTRARLEEYASEWSTLRTGVCEQSLDLAPEQSEAQLRVAACLDDSLEVFVALTKIWASADEVALPRAAIAPARLPALSSCTDQTLLRHQLAERDLELQRPRSVELRGRLEEVHALEIAGDYGEALELGQIITAHSRELGLEALTLEAELLVGQLHHRLGAHEPARTTLEHVFGEAGRAGYDLLALDAALVLSDICGTEFADYEAGKDWAALALMFIERMELGSTQYESRALNHLGAISFNDGALPEALDAHRRALSIQQDMPELASIDLAETLAAIGRVLRGLARYEEALVHMHRALGILEQVYGPEHPEVAALLDAIGFIHYKREAFEDARIAFARAVAIYEVTLGEAHADLGGALSHLVLVEQTLGNYEGALVDIERARAVLEASLGPTHPDVIQALTITCALHDRRGELELALATCGRAATLAEQSLRPGHPDLAVATRNLGSLHIRAGNHELGLAAFHEALAIYEESVGPVHTSTASVLLSIGSLELERGDVEAAREPLQRALDTYVELLGPEHPKVALSLEYLARVELAGDHTQRAQGSLERALAIRERDGSDALALALTKFDLAQVIGTRARARKLAAEARDVFDAHGAQRERDEVDAWLRSKT